MFLWVLIAVSWGCSTGSAVPAAADPGVECNRARVAAHDAIEAAMPELSLEVSRARDEATAAEGRLTLALAPHSARIERRMRAELPVDVSPNEPNAWLWREGIMHDVIEGAADEQAILDAFTAYRHARTSATGAQSAFELAETASTAFLGTSAVAARDAMAAVPDLSFRTGERLPSVNAARAAAAAAWEACRDISP